LLRAVGYFCSVLNMYNIQTHQQCQCDWDWKEVKNHIKIDHWTQANPCLTYTSTAADISTVKSTSVQNIIEQKESSKRQVCVTLGRCCPIQWPHVPTQTHTGLHLYVSQDCKHSIELVFTKQW